MANRNPRLEWFNRERLTRFFSKVSIGRTCWIWNGAVNGKGYGIFRGTSAHRFTYTWFTGPIPAGLVLDHLCLNRVCVNPAHLEAVTDLENRRRAASLRTACRQGHSYRDFVMWLTDTKGYRYRACSECHRIKNRAYHARLRLSHQKHAVAS
jgi:hypothetical protein